ncbi:CARDB domain-containing protein [Singulisphaera sp. PoT]|uniref:CARDB domain-containing protein n=1 Tax=Singulisphaera sp. PoT TaxID=3411797 RepID=UPI003BF46124
MPSQDRRAAARRRAWGRGPHILRFDSLEHRQLLAASALPDLLGNTFAVGSPSASWGDSIQVSGTVQNQGQASADQSFQVSIVASTSPIIGPGAVTLGQVTIPAGLAPGQSAPYSGTFELPATPLAKFNGGPIYIAAWTDPNSSIKESNKANNFAVGNGYDEVQLNIVTHQPSDLIGTSLGVTDPSLTWGKTVTVSGQVQNNAAGDAPPTRAAIVLTPAGTNPGTNADVTVGFLDIPAIPAWQTVNVVQTFKLPDVIPNPLAGQTSFTLSMIQDTDYVINPMYPHAPTQGLGKDQVAVTINPDPNSTVVAPPQADLAAGTLTAPTSALPWGQDFQVSGSVQNIGTGAAGKFQVSFVLTGTNSIIGPSIYLGGTTIDGLASGATQDITQTLHLPGRLPNGVNLIGNSAARIAMIVDSLDQINEPIKTNNVSNSNPITLRLLGADGTTTVPTYPPSSGGMTVGTAKPASSTTTTTTTTTTAAASTQNLTKAQQHKLAVQSQLAAARAARNDALEGVRHQRRTQRKVYPKVTNESLGHKIEHQLKVFPDKVSSFFNNLFH